MKDKELNKKTPDGKTNLKTVIEIANNPHRRPKKSSHSTKGHLKERSTITGVAMKSKQRYKRHSPSLSEYQND